MPTKSTPLRHSVSKKVHRLSMATCSKINSGKPLTLKYDYLLFTLLSPYHKSVDVCFPFILICISFDSVTNTDTGKEETICYYCFLKKS